MTIVAAVLSIQLFVGHLKESRLAEGYALMTPVAKMAFGRAAFDAYIESRRRILGAITGVTNVRESKQVQIEGMKVYEADVQFERGTSPSWFIVSDAGAIHRFGLDMPAGKAAVQNDADAMPVIQEILAIAKSEGVVPIAYRFSPADLQEVEQTPEQARKGFELVDMLLGKLQTYTTGKAERDSDGCVALSGEGKFQHGDGPFTMRVCWQDGVWRLRHMEITPLITPALLERSIAWALKGEVTAKCPRTEFPVNGTIVCRLTPKKEPPQDATVLRTSPSGWKIVGLQPVK